MRARQIRRAQLRAELRAEQEAAAESIRNGITPNTLRLHQLYEKLTANQPKPKPSRKRRRKNGSHK